MEMYIKDQPAEFVSAYALSLRNPQDKKDEGMAAMEKMIYDESALPYKERLYKLLLRQGPKAGR